MTTRFFQAAGVVGMASMEYKRDTRSGEFHMVEPTIGRTDYQEEVATLNGVNLPYAAWCSELGLPLPPPAATKRPVVWRVRSEDVQSAAAQGQRITQGYPRDGKVADAVCRWRDPMPCLVQGLRHVRRALLSRTSKRLPGSPMAGSKS
jgi:predicted ATP-grasp superfamily ATP-dependent carboligase